MARAAWDPIQSKSAEEIPVPVSSSSTPVRTLDVMSSREPSAGTDREPEQVHLLLGGGVEIHGDHGVNRRRHLVEQTLLRSTQGEERRGAGSDRQAEDGRDRDQDALAHLCPG